MLVHLQGRFFGRAVFESQKGRGFAATFFVGAFLIMFVHFFGFGKIWFHFRTVVFAVSQGNMFQVEVTRKGRFGVRATCIFQALGTIHVQVHPG